MWLVKTTKAVKQTTYIELKLLFGSVLVSLFALVLGRKAFFTSCGLSDSEQNILVCLYMEDFISWARTTINGCVGRNVWSFFNRLHFFWEFWQVFYLLHSSWTHDSQGNTLGIVFKQLFQNLFCNPKTSTYQSVPVRNKRSNLHPKEYISNIKFRFHPTCNWRYAYGENRRHKTRSRITLLRIHPWWAFSV